LGAPRAAGFAAGFTALPRSRLASSLILHNGSTALVYVSCSPTPGRTPMVLHMCSLEPLSANERGERKKKRKIETYVWLESWSSPCVASSGPSARLGPRRFMKNALLRIRKKPKQKQHCGGLTRRPELALWPRLRPAAGSAAEHHTHPLCPDPSAPGRAALFARQSWCEYAAWRLADWQPTSRRFRVGRSERSSRSRIATVAPSLCWRN
jgi:hypothetical protein